MKNGRKNNKTPASGKKDFPLFDQLVLIIRELNKIKAKYVLIGGIACNLHGIVRATKDIY